MSALPLQRIEGKYEILEKLREGGMGAIYKVRHRLLDEIRVIKLMRQQLVEDEELKTRFAREARLAIKLRHPNIAQLYDFTVDDDGTAFIVMEFIDGMTLEEVVTLHGPPPLGFALETAQQSLRALGYLHDKGFIHRDISPDNLMLTADTDGQPLVKLIDLGIAKILGVGRETHLTQTGTFLGKIRYSPPEQFGSDGAAMVDARGDLYSFGVVLYELLTGRYPIQGRDHASLIAGHLFRPPLGFADTDPQGRVPEGLREVVLKTLAKTPEERFATAQELSRALAAFRVSSDVDASDLNRLLTRPFIRAGAASLLDPGSTQERLDENFNLAPTPSAGSLLEIVPPPPTESKAVREVAGTIGLQLQQGELLTAEAELRWAVDTYGEQPALRTLRDNLQEVKLREAERQARDLLQQARALFGSGDLGAALEHLQEAQALDPRNPDLGSLREQTEQAIQQRNEDRERDRELAAAVAGIEAALDTKDYRAAETLLYGAEASFGGQEVLSPLHERLAELRRRDLAEKIRAHLASARRLAGEERFDDALAELRRATDLAPSHSEVRTLTQEIQTAQRWQREEKRRAAELELAAATLEGHLQRRELTEAARLLEKTAVAHGDRGPLPELRTRLESLRRQAEERPPEPESLPPAPVAAKPIPPEPVPRRDPAPQAKVEPPPKTKPAEARPEKLPEPLAPPRAALPSRAPWKLWVSVAAGALLVVIALVLFLGRHRESPASAVEATPGPATPAPVPASAPAAGTLVLDAVPWGEVVQVVDGRGQPRLLGAQRFTPLVLSLPPGRYTITLRNPSSPKPVSLSAEVLTGAEVRSVADFGAVSEEELFRSLGW